MDKEQRKRIIDKHRISLANHGHSPHALYWSSREVQQTRFRVLAEIGIESGNSVLDVGCGFGDMYGWLQRQGIDCDFTGIDLSPDLIAKGQQLYPKVSFFCGELFDYPAAEPSFDWVVLSGSLNDPVDESGDYALRTIAAMYRLCRKGVAFNLLDATEGVSFLSLGLQHFDPLEIERVCEGLTPHQALVRGYLKGDFTVYLWRDSANKSAGRG